MEISYNTLGETAQSLQWKKKVLYCCSRENSLFSCQPSKSERGVAALQGTPVTLMLSWVVSSFIPLTAIFLHLFLARISYTGIIGNASIFLTGNFFLSTPSSFQHPQKSASSQLPVLVFRHAWQQPGQDLTPSRIHSMSDSQTTDLPHTWYLYWDIQSPHRTGTWQIRNHTLSTPHTSNWMLRDFL